VTKTSIVLFSETNSAFGEPILQRLLAAEGIELAAVVVREPGHLCDYYLKDPVQVDLAATAEAAGVRVLRPARVNAPPVIAELRKLQPDYFVVANYQQILKDLLLSVPTVDTINFHPSPLPRYAGLAPFYWMSVNHETAGGVSAVKMTRGLDDGPILAQQLLRLTGRETPEQIRASHFEASWRLFDLVLPTLIDRTYCCVAQNLESRTYYSNPPKHEAADELRHDPVLHRAM
jgi:methionyl-tRNA formyltransferase